jgi:hypothetical protein
VIAKPSGRVIGEMTTVATAKALAGSFNRCGTGAKAVIVPYCPGEVLEELVPTKRAKQLVEMHNEEWPGEVAVAVPYKSKSAAKAKFRSA